MATQVTQCTPFCSRLASLRLIDGKLPGYDALLAHLADPDSAGELSWQLGKWGGIRSRPNCGFCRLVASAVLAHVEDARIERDQEIKVYLGEVEDEAAFRLSFPTRVGMRLVFVARTESQVSGPDGARLVTESTIPLDRIRGWIDACRSDHEATCSASSAAKQPDDGRADPSQPLSPDSQPRSPGAEERTHFRCIDLERGCVRQVPLAGTVYVALSYVWGQLPTFQLLKSNLEVLTTEGSLEGIRPSLPRTINDAINLVRSLGERYLWVDSLCLVQDDDEDIRLGVQSMSTIYRLSLFAVVAGSGAHADAGLQGVHPTPRVARQVIEEVAPGGLQMTVLHSIDWHLKRSVYGDRGWTLQEIVLPSRAIIFINNQAYFRCQEANWAEESTSDCMTHWMDWDDCDISRLPAWDEGVAPAIWAYQKLCEDYARRQLRFDGDALRAVSGICLPLAEGMRTPLVEGLPLQYLDFALLFISCRGDLRRRRDFPSYSWAGWAGEILFARENYKWPEDGEDRWKTINLFKWLRHCTFINWSIRLPEDQKGGWNYEFRRLPARRADFEARFPWAFSEDELEILTRVVPDTDAANEERAAISNLAVSSSTSDPGSETLTSSEKPLLVHTSDRDNFFLKNILDTKFGALTRRDEQGSGKRKREMSVPPESSDSATGWQNAHVRFRGTGVMTRRKTMEAEAEAEGEEAGPAEPAPQLPPSAPANTQAPPEMRASYPLLEFWTTSLFLKIGKPTHKTASSPKQSAHTDPAPRDDPLAGDRRPGLPLLSRDGQTVGSLHPDNTRLPECQPGVEIECIILSQSIAVAAESALWESATAETSEADPTTQKDEGRRSAIFWALQIVWVDGVAERRGVAQVLRTALRHPGSRSEAKHILLG